MQTSFSAYLKQLKLPNLVVNGERSMLLICLSLSLIFWLFVKMSKTYESKGNVNIEYQVPLGRKFLEAPPAKLAVSYSGLGWDLVGLSLFRKNKTIHFQLSDRMHQELQRDEIISKIEEQTGLKVLDINRNYLSVALDSTASRRVEVVLDSIIQFNGNYHIRDSISLRPRFVTLFGASQLLDKIHFLKTEKIAMECPREDFRKTLQIINPRPDLIQLSESQTEVYIPVEEFTEKTFTVALTAVNATDSISLAPRFVQLSCVVGLSRYKSLTADDFLVVADFTGTDPGSAGSNTIPLTIAKAPSWVRSLTISPASAEFLIIQ